MEFFTENTRLIDIINKDHQLLNVLIRLGINLGFGDKTIRYVCKDKKISAGFMIDIINVYHNENYFPENRLKSFSVKQVVDYLTETHKYYTEYVIPELERLIGLLFLNEKSENQDSRIIKQFLKKYKREFLEHISYEEEFVFPYINCISSESDAAGCVTDISRFKNFTISDFEARHSDIEEKIVDLKNVMIKYLRPGYNNYIGNAIISNLILFEKDLEKHTRIEERILIPKVKLLESGKI